MVLKIAGAMAEFQAYLWNHMGEPVGTDTLMAFNAMMQKIITALKEG